jgi:hypothetical protein
LRARRRGAQVGAHHLGEGAEMHLECISSGRAGSRARPWILASSAGQSGLMNWHARPQRPGPSVREMPQSVRMSRNAAGPGAGAEIPDAPRAERSEICVSRCVRPWVRGAARRRLCP